MKVEPQSRKIKPTLRDATRFGIAVVGVGGGGGNIVSYLSKDGIDDVDFYAVNTDRQALDQLDESVEAIQIGDRICNGEGAGGDPDVARNAAQENTLLLTSKFNEKRLLFLVTCMGGGTGTGASPIIANFATRDNPGLLTISIVMTPKGGEGDRTVAIAANGVDTLREEVDAMMIIPNDREGVGMRARHREVNRLVFEKIDSITRLLVNTQIPNIDMSDLKATLKQNSEPAVDMFIGTATLDAEENDSSPLQNAEGSNNQSRFDVLLDRALQSDWLTIDFDAPIPEGRGVLSFTLGGDEDDEEIDDITDESSIKHRVERFQTGAASHNLKIGSFIDEDLPKGTLKATVVLRAAHLNSQVSMSFTQENEELEDYITPFDPSALPDAKEVEDVHEDAEDFNALMASQRQEAASKPVIDLAVNNQTDTETTRRNRS